jgi:hypothetical protein
MNEKPAIVSGGVNRNKWHEPHDDSTESEPLAECYSRHSDDSDPNWRTRRREIARDWYEKCAYCAGEYQAATNQRCLPTQTEVPSDD